MLAQRIKARGEGISLLDPLRLGYFVEDHREVDVRAAGTASAPARVSPRGWAGLRE